ncbi:MAG TPA: WecB/TagA/CpsF family glycosyltransferase [Chthonomonadaceae bacterium]|nr:WecB/TagA/CpsF family glycosyltransferase [Chthonomonadaceae bacterium]
MAMTVSAPSSPLPSLSLLGAPIHNVDMETALEILEGFIQEGGPHHVVTADSSMLVMAQEDAALRAIIGLAELVTPDSTGILWAARRHGSPLRERVSGVEIVERLCARSATHGYRLFFLGAAPGVAEQAADRMCARYPGAQIAGARHGYFSEAETPALLEEIRSCHPDVLCVAMGIPRQEKWIAAHREALGVPVMIGVGGTFDVLSGRTRRAPRWMQRLSLEWLWRVLSNPRKIGKVMLLPRFVLLTLRDSRRR